VRRIARHRPSPALVIACAALLIALTGTSIAAVEAVPNNSVGTAQLKNNAVTAAKIASNAVNAAKIASNAVTASEIASNAVATAEIASNAVTSAKVQDGTLLSADFQAGQLPQTNGFARFLNGPLAVPLSATTLATLTISQPGDYLIWGKAYLTAPLSTLTECRLQAGGDFDLSQATPANAAPATLALNVGHTFAAAGTADFQCDAAGAGVAANFIKISAIKLGSLTNSG
jgi:hypothetical protein